MRNEYLYSYVFHLLHWLPQIEPYRFFTLVSFQYNRLTQQPTPQTIPSSKSHPIINVDIVPLVSFQKKKPQVKRLEAFS